MNQPCGLEGIHGPRTHGGENMGKAGILPATQKQGGRMAVDMSTTCPAQSLHVGDGDVPSWVRANRGGRARPLPEDFHGPHKGQINQRKQSEEGQ